MKNIIVFGYGYEGTIIAKQIHNNPGCHFWGFADNSPFKQGFFSYGYPIRDIYELTKLNNEIDFSVIIASKAYDEIIEQCREHDLKIEGVYFGGEIHYYPFATFESLDYTKDIRLYAGDIYDSMHYNMENLYGLSINRWDEKHIFHDIRKPYPLPEKSIMGYEAEDVFEYVERKELIGVIDEIYRILKPGGCLRICMPDYNSPYIKMRAMSDSDGRVIFDAGGGGTITEKGIVNGGQVYFATYEDFQIILEGTMFRNIEWLCYYSKKGNKIKKHISSNNGYLNRVNYETDGEDYCLVVDCYK